MSNSLAQRVIKSGNRVNLYSRNIIFMLLGMVFSLSSFAADPDWVFHLNEEFEEGYFYSIAVKAGDMLYIGGVTAAGSTGRVV